MKNSLELKGFVRYFVTDNKTGLMVPGTYHEQENTIQTDLKNYLAYVIGSGGTLGVDYALDNLFDAEDYTTQQGKDGIGLYKANSQIQKCFVTVKNQGGTGSENYIEFYGTIQGPETIYADIWLGHNLDVGTRDFQHKIAKTTTGSTVNVDSGRTFHFYWKITIN